MTGTPTQEAESYWRLANDSFVYIFQHSTYPSNEYNLASGCNNMAMALKHLSVGLRAAYIELEEVKRLLQQRLK